MIVSSAAGSFGFTRLGVFGFSFRMAFISRTRFLPAKGRWPVAIS